MAKIIFAKTRQPYQSYSDLYTLATLAKFPVLYLDEIDWQTDVTVVIGTVNHEADTVVPDSHRARLIQWYLERPGVVTDKSDMAFPAKHAKADALWASDRAVAKLLDCQYVFMGGHIAFGKINFRTAPRYDFCTLAYHNTRRQSIVDDLRLAGLTWADESGGVWGDDRRKRLHESALCINIHQDNQRWHEPIRFMVLACHAVPILSEPCIDPGYFSAGYHYVEADTTELACTAQLIKDNAVMRARLAAAAWRLVCDTYPFRECVLEAGNK